VILKIGPLVKNKLSDSGPRDCAYGIEYSEIRNGACYICCKLLGHE
jgi:hypothetical protein